MMFHQILVQIIALCIAYDLKCPEQAEWLMRSTLLCPNPTKYSCLHDVFAPSGFTENCSIVDFERGGKIIVLRGGIDSGNCKQNRYQPARNQYWTNISTDCIYLKSLCNEEGQVVHREDPTYTRDTTCRCDYTRGYDFVIRPSHPCYCIPSQEDCSCFLKRCSDTQHLLSPDYQCIDRTQTNITSSCPVLENMRLKDTDQIKNMTHLADIRNKREKYIQYMVIVVICFVIVAAGMVVTEKPQDQPREDTTEEPAPKVEVEDTQFTSDLKVVSVRCMEGHTLTLQCTANRWMHSVKWTKNGVVIWPTLAKESKQRCIHEFTIEDATFADSGKYSIHCGKSERSLEVNIQEYFTEPSGTMTCIEGETVQLEWEVFDDNQTAVWFKDDTDVSTSNGYKVERHGKLHRLVVNEAQLDDKGEYLIRIKNCFRSTKLNVQDYFTKPLEAMTCIEGETVKFECEVCDDNQTAVWFKDGTDVSTLDRYNVERHGQLHRLVVIEATLDDNGEYSVRIKNCVRRTKLKVQEGETVEFKWEVLDDNQTARWFKDGTEVSTSNRYKVERQGKLHRLVVNETKLNDKGDYLISIKNCIRLTNLKVQELQEMPTAIQQLSAQDKALYIDLIKAGTEKRYSIKIVIIGENGVGKTCLLRRLLQQSTAGVQSTDGIEMHRCKIRLRDGEWIFNEVLDKKKELLTRIKMASHPSSAEDETLQLNSDNFSGIGLQENDDTQNSNRETVFQLLDKKKELLTRIKMASHPSTTEGETLKLNSENFSCASLQQIDDTENSNRETLNTTLNSSPNQTKTLNDILLDDHVKRELKQKTEHQSSTTIPNLSQVSEVKIKSDSQPKRNITMSKLMTEKVMGLDNILNDIDTVDVPAEKFVECRILDFAGEKEYYATHPIFLNPNALHLLVTNIMKDVKPIAAEVGFDNIAEFIDFWLDTIHSGGVEDKPKEETNTKFLYPPAIIVCTRIDECRGHLHEKKEDFRKQLLHVLRNEAKKKHIREICYVSNTESDEEDFDDLRKTIFDYGRHVKTFEETLPLNWIGLEQSLDVLREAELNILSWQDMVELSSKCSIDNKDEINLFLKYQHKVGGVIYFENLKDYIILNQKWLANAFRCLVSDKFDSNLKLSDEWKALEDTGKLEHSLVVKLFAKEPTLDFNKHSSHILSVMEIFGIIVKLTTLMEDGQRHTLPTYYLPCMISEKASITDVINRFSANKDNCKRTPWLCIEFDFMPLDFFNHVLCNYISQYAMSTEPLTGRMAIYYGMGVFFLDSTKLRKFILCFCKNTIALQIWQWSNIRKGTCKAMLSELEETIERLKKQFETRRVSYTVKAKCTDGKIHISAGRHSYRELVHDEDKYFCEEHSESHNVKAFFKTWFEDYKENTDNVPVQLKLKGITDTRFKQKCHVCNKNPSVYWCHGCQRSMCKDCNNQHRKSTDTKYHIVQHVQDVYSWYYNFRVDVRDGDMKVLHNNMIVKADFRGKQLVTCDITGQQQHTIPIPGTPNFIAVVDNNTVAVTSVDSTTILIVDVGQRQIIQHIDVQETCNGIMYRDNQLFIAGHDRTIKVMNMSGEVARTIPVGRWHEYICGGEAGRIYYTDREMLHCIDTVGTTLFTFTDPSMKDPRGITTDDEGHVLVLCRQSANVLRISPDGKQSRVIIAQIPSSEFQNISYHSLSKSVVIGLGYEHFTIICVYK